MITQWIKEKQTPLLIAIIYGLLRLALHSHNVQQWEQYRFGFALFNFSNLITIFCQSLFLFFFASLVANRYNLHKLNKRTIAYSVLVAIAGFILIFSTSYLWQLIFAPIIRNSSIYSFLLLFILRFVHLLCLTLPYIVLIKAFKFQTGESDTNNLLTTQVLAYAFGVYLLVTMKFTTALLSFPSRFLINNGAYLTIISLILISITYLYFWYKPVFEQKHNPRYVIRDLNRAFLLLTVSIMTLLLLTTYILAKIPPQYILKTPSFILKPMNGLLGYLIGFSMFILAFFLSPMRYYKLFHGAVMVISTGLIFYYGLKLSGGNYGVQIAFNAVGICLSLISLVLVIFGSLSRLILRESLKSQS